MANGTISNITYPVLCKSLNTVNNKPHSVRTDLMQCMLGMGCNMAKAVKAFGLFAKSATTHVVQKSVADNLLHDNLQIAKLGNLWVDTFTTIRVRYELIVRSILNM